ncbi:CoxG family protein [Paraburkholderia megapolitana]|uniref:Carbon monoxide dehydrogenase subunit G n=1 Tax=Paraburkholderia megapolitana TaxID=420953 RepID=A0A1I3IFG8_9BURK|nr:SRPBCC domain-containing protein [Paraburkholderia megapolitana]SFI46533.1 Carbon monoxide dehydrogenase subunit G [Paraburkholderia megapolitana]
MELNDALRIPLALSDVRDALQDIALLRASLDNCESFNRLGHGEYALTLTVPLGPLRARYQVRAHVASDDGTTADVSRRTLNFKARADGIGALRGQIGVTLRAGDSAADPAKDPGTRIDYSVWATLTGPLTELPARQIENALHELADDFFTEFCAVVQAKHGQGPNRARGVPHRRQHVFLRPIGFSGAIRRARAATDRGVAPGGRVAPLLGARASHGVSHREPDPHGVPNWAWAAMIFFVALLLYGAHWLSVD